MLWRSVRQPSPDRKWVPCPRPTDDLCQTDVSPGQAHVTVVTWRLLTHDAVLRFCSGVVPPYLRVDARTASVGELNLVSPHLTETSTSYPKHATVRCTLCGITVRAPFYPKHIRTRPLTET